VGIRLPVDGRQADGGRRTSTGLAGNFSETAVARKGILRGDRKLAALCPAEVRESLTGRYDRPSGKNALPPENVWKSACDILAHCRGQDRVGVPRHTCVRTPYYLLTHPDIS
jgi:hypothetical protein